MKKRFVKYIATIALILWGTACSDFVDVVPDNIAVIEEAFETRLSTERFLATLYGYLPPFASINNPALTAGDEIAVNINTSRNWGGRRIGLGGQSKVDPSLGYWGNTGSVRNLFIAIRDCNIFINNVDRPFDLGLDEQKKWAAEAKVLKAYYHFYLMRMYGPIPISRTNIEVSEGVEAVRVFRDPVDEVAAYIVELLDEAIPNLPDQIQDRALELGRVTKPIAAALKAKVLITAASPLFNGNTDYSTFVDKSGNPLVSQTVDELKWVKAAEACKEAIDIAEAAGHQLYEFMEAPEDWSDTTVLKLSIRGSVTERWNDEVIWGSSENAVSTLQNWAQAKVARGLSATSRESVQSWWSPPLRIAEMFYTENGVPIDEDVNYNYDSRYEVSVADEAHQHYVKTGFETANLHYNREPRFYASIGFDGGIWEGHGETTDDDELFVEGKKDEKAGRQDANRWSSSGYWAKKLVYYQNIQRTSGSGYSSRSYPFPVIRLADLYLLYAEALNESSGPSTAYEWIDRVRSRAGLDGVVSSWTASSTDPTKPSTKEGLREIIQNERMIELVFEGQRFWDLRRWKRASEFMNSDAKGWNIEGETTADYYNVISIATYKFLRRDYLWPISETDIIANSNLIQNPLLHPV